MGQGGRHGHLDAATAGSTPGREHEMTSRWWDPLGMWQEAARPFTDMAAGQVPGWGSSPLQGLLDALRRALVGRPVTVGEGAQRLSFTLTTLEARVEPQAAATGQADDVVLEAKDVVFQGWSFATVTLQLGNVHTRVGGTPALVSAPVDVTATLTLDVLRRLVPLRQIVLDGLEDGGVRVRWSRSPGLGWMELRPVLHQGQVGLRPTALGRSRAWSLGDRLPVFRPRLPLPDDARVTGVRVREGRVEVRVRVDERRVDYRQVVALARRGRRSG
jgi:hypothetical protein